MAGLRKEKALSAYSTPIASQALQPQKIQMHKDQLKEGKKTEWFWLIGAVACGNRQLRQEQLAATAYSSVISFRVQSSRTNWLENISDSPIENLRERKEKLSNLQHTHNVKKERASLKQQQSCCPF